MTWRERAACREMDNTLFFPIRTEMTKEDYNDKVETAIAICQACPVREQCYEEGKDMEYGIWGGVVR